MQQPKGKALASLQMSRSREVWRGVADERAVLYVSPQVVPDVSWPFSVGFFVVVLQTALYYYVGL